MIQDPTCTPRLQHFLRMKPAAEYRDQAATEKAIKYGVGGVHIHTQERGQTATAPTYQERNRRIATKRADDVLSTSIAARNAREALSAMKDVNPQAKARLKRRVRKQAACGALVHKESGVQDIKECHQPGCANPYCAYKAYERRHKKYTNKFTQLFKASIMNEETAYQAVLLIDFLKEHPRAGGAGYTRKQAFFDGRMPPSKAGKRAVSAKAPKGKRSNTTARQMHRVTAAAGIFFAHPDVQQTLGGSPHAFSVAETSFMLPHEGSGMRTFPNHHIHVNFSSKRKDVPTMEAQLTAQWQRITGTKNARVEMCVLDRTQESAENLGKYHSKVVSISGSWAFQKMRGHEVFAALGERSLQEALAARDVDCRRVFGRVQRKTRVWGDEAILKVMDPKRFMQQRRKKLRKMGAAAVKKMAAVKEATRRFRGMREIGVAGSSMVSATCDAGKVIGGCFATRLWRTSRSIDGVRVVNARLEKGGDCGGGGGGGKISGLVRSNEKRSRCSDDEKEMVQ